MATANKTFQTRIQLKYDSYENWTSNNPVLLSGEIAVATIPAGASVSTSTGTMQNLPNVVLKVGDGSSHYNDLKFVSGLAADVYEWAKASQKPSYAASEISGLTEFVQNISDVDTNTEYQLVIVDAATYKYKLQKRVYANNAWGDWTDTETLDLSAIDTRLDSVEASLGELTGETGGIQTAISTAINSLDSTKSQTAGADGLALKVVQADGVITEISGSIAAETYDAYGAAKAVQGDTTNTVAGVETLANDAQKAADAAQADVDAEVIARQNAINALDYNGYVAGNAEGTTISFVGTISETDGVISATKRDLVFESAYNAETNKAATMADVTSAVADLNGAMHFEGVVSSDPTAEGFDTSKYVAGDVVIFGTIEYVYDGSKFVKLGDETLAGTLIAALDKTTNNSDPSKTVASIVETDGIVTATFQAINITSDQVTVNDKTLTDKITELEDATSSDISNVQDQIDSNKEAIDTLNGDASTEGSVQNTINKSIDALDANKSQTASASNGYLALNVVEENGLITSISGSVANTGIDERVTLALDKLDANLTGGTAPLSLSLKQENGLVTSIDGSVDVDSIYAGLASTVTAGDNKAIQSITQENGVLKLGAAIPVSTVGQTGKVQDLIQDSDTYIVFNCGSSTVNV